MNTHVDNAADPRAAAEPVTGRCPVVHLGTMSEVIEVVRSNKVHHHPDMFAAVHADPVNGGINVREFLDGSVIFTEGAEHRDRRRMLNHLLRPDALVEIREDIILPAAHRLLAQRLADTGADGVRRLDLVEFCERVFLTFTAKLIGIVDVDSDERIGALRECAGPIAAGTSSQFLQDRTAINEIALAAKRKYVEEFYRPSQKHYAALQAQIDAGERPESDMPPNVMSMIVQGRDPAYRDDEKAIVETTMMFAASVGTSLQSIVQTVEFLLEWFAEHPDDRGLATDREFLLHAIQETVRLRAPFSPYTTRMVAEDCTLAGHELTAGQELHVAYVSANRDVASFGEDANRFNPTRPAPADRRMPRYGIGFGTGIHQCFGLRVVLGHEGTGGAHVELLQLLFSHGVQRDPDRAPEGLKKDMDKFTVEDIPRYIKYPVIFSNWDQDGSATGGK